MSDTQENKNNNPDNSNTDANKKAPQKRKPKNNNRRVNNNNNKNSNKNNNNQGNQKRRMLIDASKHEETRVAVVQNNKLQDFEVESLVRRQIKGNIYLAKVTRVEPSLQAAFVNYGGNRHGFLPFSEIHPDYYRIPVADRERLMAEQEELEKKAAEEAARIAEEEDKKAAEDSADDATATSDDDDDNIEEIEDEEKVLEAGAEADDDDSDDDDSDDDDDDDDDSDGEKSENDSASDDTDTKSKNNRRGGRGKYNNRRGGRNGRKYSSAKSKQDSISDDAEDELNVEPFWKRMRRAYKIQEVIKRGQIMLIQVGKEERGNKGAAVTSYITLPGRYCVLMPNTPQSGGVSRKIANYKDRKRMREILKDLAVPNGMSVILRTAGTTRTKAEIKRDLDYLMRLWNNARDLTLKSSAPALINEEGSLIKRAIRDIYNKDIDEVIVSGDDGYKTARDMMKMLMPSHVKKVNQYKDSTPLFIKEKIETQVEEMHSPQVELKSGGYLVINPTEALISIDVNSGKSTKERNIEDTALRTNIEAAEEIARQLKLRDLGGLVVIDFIDMEKRSFNGKVERAMRDALAGDRARIQIGRISSFGLMEMSRQRLHPSLTEAHFETCPSCHGMGIVKTVDTMALTILRAIEESALNQRDSNVTVTISNQVALYLFNHHRQAVTDLEGRYNLSITMNIGDAEGEKGFDIQSNRKPKDELESDEDKGETIPKAVLPNADDTVDTRKKNNRNNRNLKNQTKDSNESNDDKPDNLDKKPEADKPADDKKPRRKRTVKKKIDIAVVEEKSEQAEEKPKPEPKNNSNKSSQANDNADDKSDIDNKKPDGAKKAEQEKINEAARAAEKINETPKSKKKGWWNKITK